MTFTDGYATASLCVPSRAGLLTGRYQQEFGVYGNPGKWPYPGSFGLPASQTTLAEALKAQGYATGIVGFRLRVTRVELKFKLNQNHPEANVRGAAAALAASTREGDREIAALMTERLQRRPEETQP